MVSEFRKKKLLRGFRSLDADKSGNIEKADFEFSLERSRKARGWDENNPKYKELHAFMMRFWDGVQKSADGDGDGKVTEEEWLQMWDEYSRNPKPFDWQAQFAKFVFDSLDDDDDGVINRADYIKALTSTGERKKEVVEAAFDKISKGKPSVSFAEFEALLKEYFTTEDPNAPGNYVFGTTD